MKTIRMWIRHHRTALILSVAGLFILTGLAVRQRKQLLADYVTFEYIAPNQLAVTNDGNESTTIYIEELQVMYHSQGKWYALANNKHDMSYCTMYIKKQASHVIQWEDFYWDINRDNDLKVVIPYA